MFCQSNTGVRQSGSDRIGGTRCELRTTGVAQCRPVLLSDFVIAGRVTSGRWLPRGGRRGVEPRRPPCRHRQMTEYLMGKIRARYLRIAAIAALAAVPQPVRLGRHVQPDFRGGRTRRWLRPPPGSSCERGPNRPAELAVGGPDFPGWWRIFTRSMTMIDFGDAPYLLRFATETIHFVRVPMSWVPSDLHKAPLLATHMPTLTVGFLVS